MPSGNVRLNCIPAALGDEANAFPQLCHAALFSHFEYIRPDTRQRGRKRKEPQPNAPQPGRKRKAAEPNKL